MPRAAIRQTGLRFPPDVGWLVWVWGDRYAKSGSARLGVSLTLTPLPVSVTAGSTIAKTGGVGP